MKLAIVGLLVASAVAWERPLGSQKNFEAFVQKFGRNYTPAEAALRFQIFQKNMARAEALGPSHGITKFADMEPSEVRKRYGLRLRPNPLDRNGPVHELSEALGEVPATVDWRRKGVVTPVYDQGQCGSCWAFSAVEEIESMWAMAGGPLTSLSIEQVVDCDKTSGGCEGGDTPLAFEYIIGAGGITSAAAYPYTAGTTGVASRCQSRLKPVVNIKGYTWAVAPCDKGACAHQNETAMEAVVASVGPLSICVDASDDWFSYTGGLFGGSCSGHAAELNHCVQVVGYGGSGASAHWIVRNTWGTDWGEAGYILIPRGKNICGVADEASYVKISLV